MDEKGRRYSLGDAPRGQGLGGVDEGAFQGARHTRLGRRALQVQADVLDDIQGALRGRTAGRTDGLVFERSLGGGVEDRRERGERAQGRAAERKRGLKIGVQGAQDITIGVGHGQGFAHSGRLSGGFRSWLNRTRLIEAKNVRLHILQNVISELHVVAPLDLPSGIAPMKTARPLGPSPNSVDPDGEFPLGPPEYFFYLLFQAARQRDLFFDRELAPVGLNLAQWRSLAIIRRLESCTMTALARYSTVERTTLTRAVDQLVSRGLIDRSVPNRDRRQVNLSLTEHGKTIYSQAVTILRVRNQEVLAEVDPKRLRDATRVLQEVLLKLTGEGDLAVDLLNFGTIPAAAGG